MRDRLTICRIHTDTIATPPRRCKLQAVGVYLTAKPYIAEWLKSLSTTASGMKIQYVTLEMTVFWATAPCSLLEVDKRFRGVYRLHYQGDESLLIGSKRLSNSRHLPRDYTAQYPRTLSFSYSPTWEPEISLTNLQFSFGECFVKYANRKKSLLIFTNQMHESGKC